MAKEGNGKESNSSWAFHLCILGAVLTLPVYDLLIKLMHLALRNVFLWGASAVALRADGRVQLAGVLPWWKFPWSH